MIWVVFICGYVIPAFIAAYMQKRMINIIVCHYGYVDLGIGEIISMLLLTFTPVFNIGAWWVIPKALDDDPNLVGKFSYDDVRPYIPKFIIRITHEKD